MSSVSTSAPACVIYNPHAGSAERIRELDALLEGNTRFQIYPTQHPQHARELATTLAAEHQSVVIAAGGDGTVSQVVGGLMDARVQGKVRWTLPRLLLVPMGTGNDLARTLEHPDTPHESLALLEEGDVRTLDVLRWSLTPADGGPVQEGWCVNVAAGGFSAKLKEALTPEIKKRWGPLAYARAALSSVDELDPHEIRFSVDGGPMQTTQAINVIAANARYAGGGIEVAPNADPTDGLLDFVIITPGDWLDLAEVAARLMAGDLDASQHTVHVRARTLSISAQPPMPFNIDGDPIGEGTLQIEVIPGALEVLVARGASPGE